MVGNLQEMTKNQKSKRFKSAEISKNNGNVISDAIMFHSRTTRKQCVTHTYSLTFISHDAHEFNILLCEGEQVILSLF